MRWKLFIDDERYPVTHGWIIARSQAEAIKAVYVRGIPCEISFDHDLGDGPSGYDFAKWLTEYMMDNRLTFPEGFSYHVHSQNPVGAGNIRGLMDNAVRNL